MGERISLGRYRSPVVIVKAFRGKKLQLQDWGGTKSPTPKLRGTVRGLLSDMEVQGWHS